MIFEKMAGERVNWYTSGPVSPCYTIIALTKRSNTTYLAFYHPFEGPRRVNKWNKTLEEAVEACEGHQRALDAQAGAVPA